MSTFRRFGGFWYLKKFFVIDTLKRHIVGKSVSLKIYIVEIRATVFAVGDNKKKVTSGLYFSNMRADSVGPISTKICMVHDITIHSNLGFNIFTGLNEIYWGSKFPFSNWLCCHCCNSAVTTMRVNINYDLLCNKNLSCVAIPVVRFFLMEL